MYTIPDGSRCMIGSAYRCLHGDRYRQAESTYMEICIPTYMCVSKACLESLSTTASVEGNLQTLEPSVAFVWTERERERRKRGFEFAERPAFAGLTWLI